MSRKLLLTLFLFFYSQALSTSAKDWIVFWNVGQGSWTTYISDRYCLHIDSGGTWRPTISRCLHKPNMLFLTHYDWDHMGLARRLLRTYPQLCLWEKAPPNTPFHKKKYLETLPICKKQTHHVIKRVYKSYFLRGNESHAYLVANHFLITGDSDRKIEKRFSNRKELKGVFFLLAGHHGSRTSLSPELLKKMPRMQTILASCLKKKYGHPHQETLEKAKKFNAAFLTTELYGSVAFEIPQNFAEQKTF